MNDNELKRKELENADILELLHDMRDEENNSFATRECNSSRMSAFSNSFRFSSLSFI